MESSIRLVVKTPNQRFKDIYIDCNLGWTVKKLKEYLANVHPTNPESVSQKLIYSGHLLKDEQQLKEVLSKDHDSHTVHIVCPNAAEENAKAKKTMTQPLGGTENCTNGDTMPNTDGLRQRNTASSSQHPGSSIFSQWYGAGNNYNAYWQSYYTTMMEQYNQYMNQLQNHTTSPFTADQLYQWQLNMMAMYQQSGSGHAFGFMPTHQPPLITPNSEPSSPTLQPEEPGTVTDGPPPAVPMEQPQAQAEGIEQGQNNEQRNQNIPLNAGGAMFDDDDENGEERRDWLDWVHTFLRAAVMLSIMYFYSSTVRILMISLLGFLIYLYQTGWLTLRRGGRDQAENQELNQNGNGEARNQEEEVADRQNGEESGTLTENNGENNEGESLQQPQISPFRTQMNILYTFVTSFFTSLLPQGAQ